MKKLIAAVLAVALMVSLLGCKKAEQKPSSPQHVECVYVLYTDMMMLNSMIDTIFVGTVTAEKEEVHHANSDDLHNWYTLNTVIVEDVILGDVEVGSKISVLIIGREEWQIYPNVENAGGYLKEGERLLFFSDDPVEEYDRKKDYPIKLVQMLSTSRTVDDEGNLGWRENNVDLDPYTAFREYDTLQELRDGLPDKFEQYKEEYGKEFAFADKLITEPAETAPWAQ